MVPNVWKSILCFKHLKLIKRGKKPSNIFICNELLPRLIILINCKDTESFHLGVML